MESLYSPNILELLCIDEEAIHLWNAAWSSSVEVVAFAGAVAGQASLILARWWMSLA